MPGLFKGVMAQDLLTTKFESSAIMNDNGFYSVNYINLDVDFIKLKD